MSYINEKIYEKLKDLTRSMFENGWFWAGAAKLEKDNPYFAMTKHAIFYVKELDTWYCRETSICFNFDWSESIAIYEKERKLIKTENLCVNELVPGLSSVDICNISKILNLGNKLFSKCEKEE